MGLYLTLLQAYFTSDFLLTTICFLPALILTGGVCLFIFKIICLNDIRGFQRLYISFLMIPCFILSMQLSVELITIDIIKSESKFVVNVLYDKNKDKSSNTTELTKSYENCMLNKQNEALENLQNNNAYQDIRKNFRDNKKLCSFYSLHQSYNNYITK